VVNACDAGREGELIFRYVYQLAGSRLPIRRLWISSLTDEAIRQGFSTLKPGVDMEKLADAARCRSEADWLVGLNATRAVTVRQRTGPDSMLYSIGRVQTPTLAILVEREKAIQNFVPQDFWQLKAELITTEGAHFAATWSLDKAARFGNATVASEVRDRCRAHGAAVNPDGPVVESLKQSKTREPPPLLFDLTSLQRTANKRFGLSAQATLDVAQALYERHKILTYPRTDARHLSSDMAATLPKIFAGLAELDDYASFARTLLANQPGPSKRFFDDSKIQDHHAIVPTGKSAKLDALERNERRIFDLVVRRFLGAFYPDAEFAQTEVVVRVGPKAWLPQAGRPRQRRTDRALCPRRRSRWLRLRPRRLTASRHAAGCGCSPGGKKWPALAERMPTTNPGRKQQKRRARRKRATRKSQPCCHRWLRASVWTAASRHWPRRPSRRRGTARRLCCQPWRTRARPLPGQRQARLDAVFRATVSKTCGDLRTRSTMMN
jgi:reverse gyrase